MATNKVIFDGDVLVDLTGDTVTPGTLAKGTTAHNRAGEQIVGEVDFEAMQEDIAEVQEAVEQKANKSSLSTITLTVAGWNASSVSQTVQASGVTPSSNIVVSLASNATADEVSASADAIVRATAQGEGTLTFTCLSGSAPAIPLTLHVLIVG